MRTIFLTLPVYFVFPFAISAEPFPNDVSRFIYNAEACAHLAGEFDGELPRQQQDEILRNIHRYCKAAKNQWRILEIKYKGSARMMKIIKDSANDAVTSYVEQ